MLSERQVNILARLVEEYISGGEPVASKTLATGHPDNLSSATIRNELAELETLGLVCQPHTSAGRVPTERGYQEYVEHIRRATRALQERERRALATAVRAGYNDEQASGRALAKDLARLTHEAVFVAYTPEEVYYAGWSYLLQKPEFHNANAWLVWSLALDRLDEVVAELFCAPSDETTTEIRVALGSANPFGVACAAVWLCPSQADDAPLVGLLGTWRMPYRDHMARLEFLKTVFHSYHD